MMIPYGKQEVTPTDLDEVARVLRSAFITQGPVVPMFEQAVAKKVGATYAVAVNSATSALHLACLALGVRSGDAVWTSPITFVATAAAALHCGAKIEFIDIDPITFNMSPERLEEKLIRAAKTNTLPRVVIPVHMAGQSCDMVKIYELSQRFGFSVIEDASHAIGGKFNGSYIGCSAYSDITIFSFHPVKIITTGEGGMALTNKEELADRMNLLRSHGITRDNKKFTKLKDEWSYEHVALGFNYRLTDIQAALGLSQLGRLDDYVERRNEIAKQYLEFFSDLDVKLPVVRSGCLSTFHLYIIRFPSERFSKANIFSLLRRGGLGVNVHYVPLYRQPFFSSLGYISADFPESQKYDAEAITIPLYPSMSSDEVLIVVDTVRSVVNK